MLNMQDEVCHWSYRLRTGGHSGLYMIAGSYHIQPATAETFHQLL